MAVKRTIAIAFITVVVDMMGLGISLPILPLLFNGDVDFLPNYSKFQLGLIYGLLQSCFAIAQFFGAPILGRLSDRYGRKRMILLSLVGAMLGYLCFAYGVHSQNLAYLFIGRLVPGLAGGNVAIMYSSLADISTEQNKVKNFGLAGAGFGLGMILGPMAGGLLSDPSLVSWFGFEFPFLFMSCLSCLNLLIVFFFFRETSPQHRVEVEVEAIKPPQLKGKNEGGLQKLLGLGKAFRHPKLQLVFAVVLIHASGFSFFLHFVPFFLIERFGFEQAEIGLLFAYVGIWTVLTQAVLIRPIANRFKPERIVVNAIIFFALALISLLLPTKARWLFLILPVMTIFQGFYMPTMTAIISNHSDDSIQGEMLGVNQALTALSNAVPPIVGGLLLSFGTSIPLLIASGLVFVSWLVFNVFYYRLRKGKI